MIVSYSVSFQIGLSNPTAHENKKIGRVDSQVSKKELNKIINGIF